MPDTARRTTEMEVLQAIIDSLQGDAAIKEIRRGLYWTAVVSRHCGLASTMMAASCPEEGDEENAPPRLMQMTARELARFSFSPGILKAPLGLAAINSLIEIDETQVLEINAGDLLRQEGQGKNISVIGHFPFTSALREAAKNLWVIEKRPKAGDFSEGDAEKYLPKSDIVAISSTTLINHTLPGLLKLCSQAGLKMLLGPTTPMSAVLFDWGIDVISGSRVTDEKTALQYIGEGVNFRQLKRTGCIQLITMRKALTGIHFPSLKS